MVPLASLVCEEVDTWGKVGKDQRSEGKEQSLGGGQEGREQKEGGTREKRWELFIRLSGLTIRIYPTPLARNGIYQFEGGRRALLKRQGRKQ